VREHEDQRLVNAEFRGHGPTTIPSPMVAVAAAMDDRLVRRFVESP
jgi:hypothetical protein